MEKYMSGEHEISDEPQRYGDYPAKKYVYTATYFPPPIFVGKKYY